MRVHAALERRDVVPALEHADDGQPPAPDGGHLARQPCKVRVLEPRTGERVVLGRG